MTWRTFFRLIQGRRLSAPLAALLTGKGIDPQRRGADQALRHGRGGRDCQPFIPQGFVEATTTLGEYLGEHAMPWGPIDRDLPKAARLHYGQVSPPLATDLLIGTVQLRFE
jgi:hypothetical protein